ncbi:gluconate:H+ symporter [Dermacoccaceae bacterium W4C1]
MATWATAPVVAADDKLTQAGDGQLLIAALLGIAAVVLLISWAKFHPFLALIIGSAVMGGAAFVGPQDIVDSFTKGFGSTTGSVGLLVALGAMIGKLLQDSGGSDTIVDRLIGGVAPNRLPWVMALIAFILGIPLFFEVGVVLLVPVVLMVARKLDLPLMLVGIPALAGLSILHGFVPPHPGPLVAIDALGANTGTVLIYGLILAVPTLVVAGPVLAVQVNKWVPKTAADVPLAAAVGGSGSSSGEGDGAGRESAPARRPGFGPALISITLPVILMLARAVAEIVLDEGNGVRTFLEFLGTPAVALLLAVLVAMWFLGFGIGQTRSQVEKTVGSALPPIAGILLIVAAGGGFKQMLVDAGVGDVIGDIAEGSGMSPLLLGWLVAVGIRLATGSATVATITAAGIVAPLASDLSSHHLALLALAIGAGSLFFSHVNDAGFWLVKEYFGLTIKETILSWSVMETVISVVGIILVMALSVIS